MGLDLRVKGSNGWHASYSGVQLHRIQCLLAFAKRLKDDFPEERVVLDDVLSCLPRGMDEECSRDHGLVEAFLAGKHPWPMSEQDTPWGKINLCEPNYDNVRHRLSGLWSRVMSSRVMSSAEHQALRPLVHPLMGLACWVNHSDCDGRHSVREARRVLRMLSFVSPVLPQAEPWDKKWQEDLLSLYATAAKKGRVVFFH